MSYEIKTGIYLAILNQEMIELEAPDELSARIAAYLYFCKRLEAFRHYQEFEDATKIMEEDPFYKGITLVKIPQEFICLTIVKKEDRGVRIMQKRWMVRRTGCLRCKSI